LQSTLAQGATLGPEEPEVSIMERETPTVPETSTQIDLKLAAIGVVSGIVAAMAMDSVARLLGTLNGVPPVAKKQGAARSAGPAQEDGSAKLGTAAFEAVTGEKPSRQTQQWLGTVSRLGFGAAMGVNYMLASEQAPDLRRGYGTVYGSLVWAAADETALPAAGLAKKPADVPLGIHASTLGAHWVYGATLETCRRIAAAVLDAWERSGNVIEATAEPIPVSPLSGAAGAAGPT
jgi:uncharacterized membrane protein YagU involved in acid resistance